MRNAREMARFGVLTVGLGIGAAVSAMAATPVVASAETFLGDGGSAAAATVDVVDASALGAAAATITPPTLPTDFTNYALSIDGISLIHNGTATATSSLGGIAIADGQGAEATATGGVLNLASAVGAGSHASATGNFLDWATAAGSDSSASAQFGSVDLASAYGDGSTTLAGGSSATDLGYVDWATATGADSSATAGLFDGATGAQGSVDLANASGDGVSALANNGPFDAVFEPMMVPGMGADLVGDGVASSVSAGDLWTDLLSLF